MPAHLIIPIGPPACGKTTLQQWLVTEGFPMDGIVCPDVFRRIMTGDQTNQDANEAVFDVAHSITAERLAHGLDVFFDATNLKSQSRDVLFNMAHGVDAEIIMVLFNTSALDCIRRNTHRSRTVPSHIMDSMIARHGALSKASLLEEAGGPAQVFTPDQFMSFQWTFLS